MNEERIKALQMQASELISEVRRIQADANERIHRAMFNMNELVTQKLFLEMQAALTEQPEQD